VYAYALNNPVNVVGPNDKEPILGWIIGAIIGAATEYLGIIGNKMLSDEMSFSEAKPALKRYAVNDPILATARILSCGLCNGKVPTKLSKQTKHKTKRNCLVFVFYSVENKLII
jgi:hypothetical protein